MDFVFGNRDIPAFALVGEQSVDDVARHVRSFFHEGVFGGLCQEVHLVDDAHQRFGVIRILCADGINVISAFKLAIDVVGQCQHLVGHGFRQFVEDTVGLGVHVVEVHVSLCVLFSVGNGFRQCGHHFRELRHGGSVGDVAFRGRDEFLQLVCIGLVDALVECLGAVHNNLQLVLGGIFAVVGDFELADLEPVGRGVQHLHAGLELAVGDEEVDGGFNFTPTHVGRQVDPFCAEGGFHVERVARHGIVFRVFAVGFRVAWVLVDTSVDDFQLILSFGCIFHDLVNLRIAEGLVVKLPSSDGVRVDSDGVAVGVCTGRFLRPSRDVVFLLFPVLVEVVVPEQAAHLDGIVDGGMFDAVLVDGFFQHVECGLFFFAGAGLIIIYGECCGVVESVFLGGGHGVAQGFVKHIHRVFFLTHEFPHDAFLVGVHVEERIDDVRSIVHPSGPLAGEVVFTEVNVCLVRCEIVRAVGLCLNGPVQVGASRFATDEGALVVFVIDVPHLARVGGVGGRSQLVGAVAVLRDVERDAFFGHVGLFAGVAIQELVGLHVEHVQRVVQFKLLSRDGGHSPILGCQPDGQHQTEKQ